MSQQKNYKTGDSVEFSYNLKSTDIELVYADKETIGTKVTVNSNKRILTKILSGFGRFQRYALEQRWREVESSYWFFLDSPKIETEIFGYEGEEKFEDIKPKLIKISDVGVIWNKVKSTGLTGLYWRKPNHYTPYRGVVYCNGIIIKEQNAPEFYMDCGFGNLFIYGIEVLVFDNEGEFPLNLPRSSILGSEFYEYNKIKDSVFAYTAKNAHELLHASNDVRELAGDLSHELVDMNNREVIPFVFGNGVVDVLGPNIKSGTRIFVDFLYSRMKRGMIYSNSSDELLNQGCLFAANVEKSADSVRWAINRFVLMNNKSYSSYYMYIEDKEVESLSVKGEGWLYVREYDWKKLGNADDLLEQLEVQVEKEKGGWMVVSAKGMKKRKPGIDSSFIASVRKNEFMFAVVDIDVVQETDFYKYWSKLGYHDSLRNNGVEN